MEQIKECIQSILPKLLLIKNLYLLSEKAGTFSLNGIFLNFSSAQFALDSIVVPVDSSSMWRSAIIFHKIYQIDQIVVRNE